MIAGLGRPEFLGGAVRRVRLASSDLVGGVVVDGRPFSGFGYVSTGIDTYKPVRVIDGVVVEPVGDPVLPDGEFTDTTVQEGEPGWDHSLPDWWYRGGLFTGTDVVFSGRYLKRVTQVSNGTEFARYDFADSGVVIGRSVSQRFDPVGQAGLRSTRQSVSWGLSGDAYSSFTDCSFADGNYANGTIYATKSGELRNVSISGGYFDAVGEYGGRLSLPFIGSLAALDDFEVLADPLTLGLGDSSEELVARLAAGARLGQAPDLRVITYPGGLVGLRKLVALVSESESLRSFDVALGVVDELEVFDLLLGLKRRRQDVDVIFDGSWRLLGLEDLSTPVTYGLYFDDNYAQLVGVVGMVWPAKLPRLSRFVESADSLRFVSVRLPGLLRDQENSELLSRISARPEVEVFGTEVRDREWVPRTLRRLSGDVM